jgi:amino acid permease
MMAIPKAFRLLGLIPGSILMVLIACLTFFTLAGMSACTLCQQLCAMRYAHGIAIMLSGCA